MERVFTSTVGRWPKGAIKDWPPPTWQGLARSTGEPLDAFSRPVEVVAAEAVGATEPPVGRRVAARRRGRR